MKKILLFAVLVMGAFFHNAKAQDSDGDQKTLLGAVRDVDGFGGYTMEIGMVGDDMAYFRTVLGGVILNNRFSFAVYQTKLKSNDIREVAGNVVFQNYQLESKHTGFWIGYSTDQQKLFHAGVSSRLGWGQSRWETTSGQEFTENIFALIPQAEVGINISKIFKVNVGIGYKVFMPYNSDFDNEFTYGLTRPSEKLQGLTGNITLKVGGF